MGTALPVIRSIEANDGFDQPKQRPSASAQAAIFAFDDAACGRIDPNASRDRDFIPWHPLELRRAAA